MAAVVELENVKPSEQIRDELAVEGAPVLLAFSCGKDSLGAWVAMRNAGIKVIPYYLYSIPKLQFVEDSLSYYEDVFGCEIRRYPHPSLYRWLNCLVFQAPERCAVIEAAGLPDWETADLVKVIRDDFGLPASTWNADGVRAADSIVRRMSMKTHGPMKVKNHNVSPIWDWRRRATFDAIEAAGIRLSIDYEWFGRSFDGIDARFIGPLREHAPDDYARVLDWFPLAELELLRDELSA